MKRRLLTACVGLGCAMPCVAAPALAGAQGPAPAPPLAFAPCTPTQIVVAAPGLQCATLSVPLDRGEPALGNVALAVQRMAPSAPRQGVIVLLAGGPGQPAIPVLESFLAPLAREPALSGFELVAFDQRGTGQSGSLQCPSPTHSEEPTLASFFAACGTALGASRADYTSQESVEDLDALREGLGGSPLSLLSVSYGGRVAGMYAREHPQGVARMVLDSPVPLGGSSALYSERLRALPRVLDEAVCGASACSAFSRDVDADLTRLAARLRRHPLPAKVFNDHGRLQATSVTELGLYRLILGLDLVRSTRELAPAAISAAASGDVAPLARLTRNLQSEVSGAALTGAPFLDGAPTSDTELSLALFAATYCVEDALPWAPTSAPAERSATLTSFLAGEPAGATAPFAPATVVADSPVSLCEGWPATPAAPAPPTGVSATPTLILSGDEDLRTPYEQDLTIAAGYSDAQLLRVPGTGHSTVTTDQTGCALGAMISFLSAGQAPASCPSSGEPQALALAPASLSRVRPASSRSRIAGEAAAATALTLEDLLGQTSTSGGGLRGGSWAVADRGVPKLVLHRTVDVPGVTLSGSIVLGGTTQPDLSGRVALSGRVRGTLTVRGLTLSGRLGGAAVHARLVGL